MTIPLTPKKLDWKRPSPLGRLLSGTFLVALFTFALVVTSCGGGDNGSEVAANSSFGAGEDFSIVSALRQLPIDHVSSGDGNIEVYVADLLSAGDATGQRRPTGSTDSDEVIAWLKPMTGWSNEVFVPLPSLLFPVQSLTEYRSEVGFAVADVDATIESVAHPLLMTVLAGALEPAARSEAVERVLTIGEGNDFEVDPAGRTSARPLGRPLRIVSSDGLTLMSTSTDAAGAWLDESSLRLDSDEAFALAAKILDEREVIGAALVRFDDLSFDMVAVGWGVDNDRAAITVVYVVDDEAAARAAAAELEVTYSSGSLTTGAAMAALFIVDDVMTDGRAVVMSLSMSPSDRQFPRAVLDMLVRRDTPFGGDS